MSISNIAMATSVGLFIAALITPAQAVAGTLSANIVEINGGKVGTVTWQVADEDGFNVIAEGKGPTVTVKGISGRHMIYVEGDIQASHSVVVEEKGVTTTTVEARKYY